MKNCTFRGLDARQLLNLLLSVRTARAPIMDLWYIPDPMGGPDGRFDMVAGAPPAPAAPPR